MEQQTLHYAIDPFDPTGHRLRVSLLITAPNPQRQIVSLPAWIPGSYLIRDFSKNIETIRAHTSAQNNNQTSKQPIEAIQLDSHRWAFDHCTSALTIEIVVYAWDASVRGAHFDDSHCFLNGTSVFLQAHGFEHSPCQVHIAHPPHTQQWRAYSGMHTLATSDADLVTYIAHDYDELIDQPIEIGTPRVIEFEACGAPHQFVVTGHYPNLDLERIAADTRQICEAQIRLFEPDSERAPFLDSARQYVFMLMVTQNGYGGLEHRASTALMYARQDLPVIGQTKAPEGYTDFLGLVSHEYFHTWHVKRIKPAEFAPYRLEQPVFSQQLWIFEGFTSYYDDLMLLRSGVLPLEGYFKQLCKGINQVHTGTGRFKQSLAQSSFDAWTKYYKQDENAPNAIVSYYTKGALVALGLDLVIRERSQQRHSLDDVMRALWQQYGKDFYRGKPQGLAESALPALILQATGVDVAAEIERWVHQACDVPLAALLAQSGFDLQWKSADNLPSLDVTLKAQDGQLVIRQVYESGAAHLAGLSAHDKLIALAHIELAGDTANLKRVLGMYQSGDLIAAHVFRDGVLRQFEVKLNPPRTSNSSIRSMQTNESA